MQCAKRWLSLYPNGKTSPQKRSLQVVWNNTQSLNLVWITTQSLKQEWNHNVQSNVAMYRDIWNIFYWQKLAKPASGLSIDK